VGLLRAARTKCIKWHSADWAMCHPHRAACMEETNETRKLNYTATHTHTHTHAHTHMLTRPTQSARKITWLWRNIRTVLMTSHRVIGDVM